MRSANNSVETPSFPDDAGADYFIREYRTAVNPARRDLLENKPPLLILTTSVNAPESHTHRVLEALRWALGPEHKRVLHTVLHAEEEVPLLSVQAGAGLGFDIPRRSAPDRFPDFWLMADAVDHIRESRAGSGGLGARKLRDHVYRQRAERGGLPGLLWHMGGTDTAPIGGVRGFFVGLVWHSLTRTLPRWIWARRQNRRLVRSKRSGWLGKHLNATAGGAPVFELLDQVGARQAPRLSLEPDHPRHKEGLAALELILLRALLEDLQKPAVGRLLPKRRRRVSRPVLLLEIPPEGAPGADTAERFLRAFHTLQAGLDGPGPLVIAVGSPSGSLQTELGVERTNLRRASSLLHSSNPRPVVVPLEDEPFERPGLQIPPVQPRKFMMGWRAVTAVELTALAAVLVGGAAAPSLWHAPPDTRCVGGDRPVAADGQNKMVEVKPKEWYQATLDRIEAQNHDAEKYAPDRAVRTVVVFESDPPTDARDTIFDGAIPELRGIAMWQEWLINDAASNSSRVPLRVEVRPVGAGFRNAVPAVRQLIREVKQEDSGEEYEKVVGVLGFAQSTKETRDAVELLGKSGIQMPMVGTTATADEMQRSDTYWPFTPDNSEEARIEAAFAARSNIVAKAGQAKPNAPAECVPARKAVIVRTPGDLYSESLADKFQQFFQGDETVISFSQSSQLIDTPAGTQKATSPDRLASQVCQALKADPDTAVYWTARARDFTAFVNAMNVNGTCIENGLTVLGGNELTNVALTGEYAGKGWLRLYHSAHRLPEEDQRASAKTQEFVSLYNRNYAHDPWRQDGHSAVSYDAFHVLSKAVDEAHTGNSVYRQSIVTGLRNGISFDGATGFVSYSEFSSGPPEKKTLVILRQAASGPEAVVACGAYRQSVKTEQQDPACRH
ncbi:ABC transporter substrate-binding protein [Streptomyces sp. Je 1-4]|uniref:ABC transporter substrate-binding protein n=1 Tax=Streptomyces TaxID=1883 RepID=UPI0021D92365|nr:MULTISPECIES: ABC transporter substrate-binding protein [unclassified Streptomyces]UYB39790.1 ABC transporter substrate-binding protein [Streptomyces sp. Je 1-4]UZQ35844.1 ABC transporter substrate-binding protein [Streptomyces sp. Je 1-4] [Streptomyces sp. Je 1-4 4N24]UZQ43262.1 ABC transporter substrate-binding protein [Streptomyces sp. Je 1-4] [Streptomyces sp. Je 1-4 4N24_ara]